MFPSRNPNSVPSQQPPSNSQHHAKEVISELCDRIKSEYTSMYSHIQNLKGELDKVAGQRADFERYYNLNVDMSYIFTSEIHKMMDVIKRLVQACMQQVPFLPPDLQNSCVHLIEQVKHYTSNESPNLPTLHGPPPLPSIHGPPPPPHMGPPHNNHMNPPPGHMGQPHMMPSHMHPPPHIGPHHSMMNYMNRMPPPGIPPHYNSESREAFHQPPMDMYRYPCKEKECNPPPNDSCNGICAKDRNQSLGMAPKNVQNVSIQNQSPQIIRPNGNEAIAELVESIKEVQEPEVVEKNEEISRTNNAICTEIVSNEESSDTKSATGTSGETSKTPINNVQSPTKKITENDIAPIRIGQISPNRYIPGPHPYERPIPIPSTSNPSASRHSSHAGMKPTPPPYMGMPPKPTSNGSYPLSHQNHPPPFCEPPHSYPMGMPPPYIRHSSHMGPPFDPMMMPRNNMQMGPYGSMPHYPMPPPNMYSSYSSEYPDNNFGGINLRAPKSLTSLGSLQHGDVVCAVSFSYPFSYVFTGSKGIVKIWDIAEVGAPKLLSSIDCLKDNYVRACKSINDNKLLVVSGEYCSVGIWSLTQNSSGGLSVNTVCELTNSAPVCYNMAITPDEKQCYCCCSNGSIVGWDIETARVIRNYTGHVDGATSIDITKDGSLIWTGGLDATARCWDSRDGKQVHSFSFPTQVFSLCISPTSDYIVVGLENKTIELCYSKESGQRFGERHVFKVHDSCVLTVKISNSGKWLISSSKDNYTNCVRIPQGIPLFLTRENASILCTDISPDDKYIITGGGEKKATIYECVY